MPNKRLRTASVTPRDISIPDSRVHVLSPPTGPSRAWLRSRACFPTLSSPPDVLTRNHRRSRPLRRVRPTCPSSFSSAALARSQRFVPQKAATKNTSRRLSALCQTHRKNVSSWRAPSCSYSVATTNYPPPPPNPDGSTSAPHTRILPCQADGPYF